MLEKIPHVKSVKAYHEYEGGDLKSVIEIETDLPLFPDQPQYNADEFKALTDSVIEETGLGGYYDRVVFRNP